MLNRIHTGNELEKKSSFDYMCHLYNFLIQDRAAYYYKRYPDVFSTYEEAKQSAVIGCIHGLDHWDSKIQLERLEALSWHLKRYIENFMAREVDYTLRHKNRKEDIDYHTALEGFPASKTGEPEHCIVSKELSDPIQEALSQLNELERNILMLRFEADLTFPEIAQLLGKSRQRVYRHYNRALAKIRRSLDKTA
ncbi:sigma-70 family RNA polymerase sigma factor [Megasphaera hominis]|jgi:RNA polymerase sigma factor (sigma-70 family)|uniref:Sigma-70 family RNA polymerase sigma factor n=1 Tax=Megasphaera hominis TaxID=159836 RepID=A0ABR6VKH7_9FIRM|nr:sigma-70 family RNA polymerase sigma factor [Megasphaera hominis]MBC3537797.1 sigma-70 family RNA polymerase sigma factor [Megasphaera hominis]